jgi:FlaA1/EpsC-like NDP-sugar epimerase
MEGRALLDSDQLVVADIRDRERVFEVFDDYRPEVVFHTAALKHLTLLENHPLEGVKTNVFGTKNLLDAAAKSGVERFVNISTDKAADPASVLGATKLAAEYLTANAGEAGDSAFLSVRFGNVLGSRGSVLPTFLDQINSGNPVTVTHPDASRYFMTIPEAVRLVVQAGAIGSSGEVLILDMGEPVKILDLATQLIELLNPDTPIEFTGLRPGEKLHESLVAEDEIGIAKVHPRIIHTAAHTADPLDALVTLDAETSLHARQVLAERTPVVH